MATQKRTFPNKYFAWYNDDKRLAVLALDLETDSTEMKSMIHSKTLLFPMD